MESKEIVRALRCSAWAGHEKKNCEECPYLVKEEPPEWMNIEEDDGWLESCDVNRIALDAAERIEELSNEG